jgi:RNA polymerase sigma factor (sigma-70 family)
MNTPRESELALLEKSQLFLRRLRQQRTAPPALVDAWDRFYARYDGVIRRFVERRGVLGVDADDCVQDVWCYVIRKLTDFRPPRNRLGIHAWLFRISVSVAANWYRARKGTASPRQSVLEQKEPVDNRQTEAETLSEQQRQTDLVETFVGAMRRQVSEVNLRVVEMRFLEERSVGDVALALGLTRQQVWYRQHRVLTKIRGWAKTRLNNGHGNGYGNGHGD